MSAVSNQQSPVQRLKDNSFFQERFFIELKLSVWNSLSDSRMTLSTNLLTTLFLYLNGFLVIEISKKFICSFSLFF